MIFNSKQLEELENIHDSTGAFEEEGDDEGGFDEVGEAAMDWRRGLIEEAAENIKRAKTRPVEPHLQYPISSVLFDRDTRRFGRVQRSVPGYLKIVYLSGGDREYGTLDVVGYLKDQGAQKRLSELAEQLGMADVDVAHELERLGITPLEEPDEPEANGTPAEAPPPVPVMPPKPKKAAAPIVEEEPEEEESEEEEAEEVADEADDGEEVADEDDEPVEEEAPAPRGKATAAPKATSKPAPSGRSAASRAPARSERAAASAPARPSPRAAPAPARPAPGGKKAASKANVNPIDDPNGFIKANFQTMSNRELARLTGLSEHTIRRKLGEWAMKRKKEL
jgi:hypothetical protein